MKIGSSNISAAYIGSTAVNKVYVGSTEIWSAVDPDAQAFITAAGITDATQQTAINTLVVDLKADGLWSKMKAIYPFVGGTASTHKYNLKDPRDLDAAFRLVFYGGWTHSSTGATSNGTNGYADTKFNPSNQTNPYLSMGLYSSYLKNYGGVKPLMSAQDNVRGTEYNFFYGNTNSFYAAYSYPLRATGTTNDTLAGFYLGSRTADNLVFMNQNSTNFSPNTSNLTWSVGGLPNTNVVIAGQNINGTLNQYTELTCSFCHISNGLSDTEALNLYTAVQAFQTSLSRQV